MARQTYGQYCSLARALDQIGERWTLLIVRELLFGPKRFTDLIHGLPGISPNLLTDRLRALRDIGLTERVEVPPPTPAAVYRLTERGRSLEPVVVAIGRWGLPLTLPSEPGDNVRPDMLVLALRTLLPDYTDSDDATYRLRILDIPHTVRVRDRRVEVTASSDGAADVTVSIDEPTFLDVASGRVSLDEACASGRGLTEGDTSLLPKLTELFTPPRP